MELTNPTNSKLRFSKPAFIGIEGVKKINIQTEGGKPLVISAEKCFSYGLRKDEMFNSTAKSLVLDNVTTGIIEAIIAQCEEHLGKPLSKTLYRRDDGSATIYPKLDASKGTRETPEQHGVVKKKKKLFFSFFLQKGDLAGPRNVAQCCAMCFFLMCQNLRD